jgi:hypothetical protein
MADPTDNPKKAAVLYSLVKYRSGRYPFHGGGQA